MTAERSPIAYRADEPRRLDLDAIPRAGATAVAAWLRKRLAGEDPYIPVSAAYDEPPYNLVLEILRKEGSGGEVARTIGHAVMDLLVEALGARPAAKQHFSNLLALCERIAIPALESWFLEELNVLAWRPEEFEASWEEPGIRRQIVRAATVQCPGERSGAIRDLWLRVVQVAPYSTIALFGFGSRFSAQAPHLNTWWQSCPEAVRLRELRQILSSAVSREPAVVQGLGLAGEGWDEDLKTAIDQTLAKLRHAPVFVDLSAAHILAISRNEQERNELLETFEEDRVLSWKVSFAADHSAAMQALAAEPFPVIIADAECLGSDEIEALLRTWTPPPNIIVIKPEPYDALSHFYMYRGAHYVLYKPFERPELRRAADRAHRDWRAEHLRAWKRLRDGADADAA